MLKNICTNYQNSKKLNDLNINGSNNFYWTDELFPVTSGSYERILKAVKTPTHPFQMVSKIRDIKGVLAYTLEDILKILPETINLKEKSTFLEYDLGLNKNYIFYISNNTTAYCFEKTVNENLADTATKLLVRLIEDQIINIPTKKC